MPNRFDDRTLAKLAAVYAGLVFGIYWIPIRALEDAGFPGMWATVMFNLAALFIVLPLIWRDRKRIFPGRPRFHLICFGTGLGYALYVSAYVYTEVVNVIVLFYLMPIWGFLLARLFIGDPITPARWLSMILGLAGMLVILGQGTAFPLPRNIGDWMSLSAGLLWAGISLMLLMDSQEKATTYGAGFVTWSFLISLVLTWLVTSQGVLPPADWSKFGNVMVWLVPFALIVIVPAAIATVFAPTKLNPGIVGLLFMAEISVGAITAAIWAGEPFGLRQIVGVTFITLAGVLETAWLLLFRNANAESAGQAP